jgi:hypothetical protein
LMYTHRGPKHPTGIMHSWNGTAVTCLLLGSAPAWQHGLVLQALPDSQDRFHVLGTHAANHGGLRPLPEDAVVDGCVVDFWETAEVERFLIV